MKYIDAYKLKAWLKEEADKEFKETEENANYPVLCHFHNGARMQALDTIDFIDSMPDENNPEPYNPVYDEDYLNEKIAKATKSWEGVDVNKMLADCRGYEEKPSEDLREEIEMEWDSFNKHLAEYDKESEEVVWLNWISFVDLACYFYNIGRNARKED